MSATNSTTAGRLPSLDGLRGLSILLVLLGHTSRSIGFPGEVSKYWPFQLAALGVHIFFAISGFIITFLLRDEYKRKGGICYKAFYIRRVLRIIPAYYLFLSVVFVLSLRSIVVPISDDSLVHALTFTTNILGGEWIVAHSWSLCVEEQFYLLWPAIVSLILGEKFSSKWIAGIYLFVAVPVQIAGYYYLRSHSWWSNSIVVQSPYLLSGSLLALLWDDPKVMDRLFPQSPATIRRILIAGTVLMLHLWYSRGQFAVLTVSLGPLLSSLGVAYLIGSLIRMPYGLSYGILNSKAISALGTVSYGTYLWQEMFTGEPGNYSLGSAMTEYGLAVWPVNLVVPILIATISYFVIERPSLSLRRSLLKTAPTQ